MIIKYVICLALLIVKAQQQIYVGQSDRVQIYIQNKINFPDNTLNINQTRQFRLDFMFPFINTPQIAYALTIYNADNNNNQGIIIETINVTKTTLDYNVTSLGCILENINFNILAIDDPNMGAFIYGFEGKGSIYLTLNSYLRQTGEDKYLIEFNNENIQTTYMNFIIVYDNNSTDLFSDIYNYQIVSDQSTNSTFSSNNVESLWETSINVNQSQVFFGLKNFSIQTGIPPYTFYGLKISSNQYPEAQNQQVKLIYSKWDVYPVSMVKGIYMAFTLKTCQKNYYLTKQLNCVLSCRDAEHQTTNSIKKLYNTTLYYCEQCNQSCYECFDGEPNQCTVCNNKIYLNPITKSCQYQQPQGTFCQLITLSGQTFFNCELCHQSCQECSAANDQNTCLTCDVTTQYKYFYNSQCLKSQPPSTYCNNNYKCQDCAINCIECQNQSGTCAKCISNFYLYNNQCYKDKPNQVYYFVQN
ncbi:hypothetical protein ABPG72_022747 [Tetrahymena utriculariae]